jgi:hypothetical protein
VLESPDLYDAALARRLARNWVPPLEPEWDGAHLNRLWLMLRDEYAVWPWFDRSADAVVAVDVPPDWGEQLHVRAVDILRSLPTYHRLTAAALRSAWTPPSRAVVAATEEDPRRQHLAVRRMETLPTRARAKATEILRLLAQ